MKSTKLLLVSPTFYPTHGGAELRFLRYLPLLKENGINVEVITGTPKLKKFSEQDFKADWRDIKDGELESEFELQAAKVYRYKLPEKGAADRSSILLDRVIEYCRNVDTKPDVIQILSPLSFKMVGRLRKIKTMGIPVVFSYSIAHEFSKNCVVGWLQKRKVRYVYKNFDLIIVASTVLEKIVKQIDSDARVEVIPNGVDTRKFSPAINANEIELLRIKLNLPKSATIICLVGAVHPRKGTDLLIKAWSSLVNSAGNLHLLLIGPRFDQQRGDLSGFKKSIESDIENSGAVDNVHFVGQVENVADYLKASDIFVFPSQKEGMPNAVLEAMATGLPTVLTPFIGLSEEMGEPGREYVLVERTSDSISRGIQAILSDNSKCSDFAGNARKWVVDTMDMNVSASMHAKVYSSVAHQSHL